MKYHVVYGKGDVVYYTTNYSNMPDSLEPDVLFNIPDTQVITWQLNELPLTLKFIDNWKRTVVQGLTYRDNKEDFTFNLGYDVYRQPTEQPIMESRVKMNEIINKVNNTPNIWFQLPEELLLDEEDINNVHQDKLNKLHDLFEQQLPVMLEMDNNGTLPDNITYDEMYLDFQTINMLVHYNEKVFQYIGEDKEDCLAKLSKAHPHYFTALKLNYAPPSGDHDPTYYCIPMLPEDYNNFIVHKPKGWLELDFGTVGKDLVSCAWTNDMELIKNDACSQQIQHHPWVAYGWIHHQDDIHHRNNIEDRYAEFIEDNNVADYIDLNNPIYTPGRHIIGECISHDFNNPSEFIDNIIATTPKVIGICITDDDNKSIL